MFVKVNIQGTNKIPSYINVENVESVIGYTYTVNMASGDLYKLEPESFEKLINILDRFVLGG